MGHTRGHLPPIALAMGEPAGIGPAATVLAWKTNKTNRLYPFFYVGDPRALLLHAPRLPWRRVASAAEVLRTFPAALPVWPVEVPGKIQAGRPDPKSARAVVGCIETAVRLCQAEVARAMVTNPIHKATLLKAGFRHPGHTEFLGKLAKATPVMMLTNAYLCTVPITVHVPLKDVPHSLSRERIVATVEIAVRDLKKRFGLRHPRLAMTGLNPHAG
ncbi:MAG TPA: 4-hydroxythreonine-4-phosphate dehydrogenase PdxA, partial [Sphingomonadales bacterium]|nr:4-hydroxythreonine-4-phosphate dehydrogenase PdxA [Sphingomonadales bacterium]